ncbi:MAG: signal peptidase II [Anaerolineales bacterium]|nr:signal peptidase II [Anaerolineales bacterium]
MKYLRDYGLLLGMAGIVIILDQWTKALVRNNLPIGGIWMPLDWLRPYARIVHWYNSGAAFGLFQNGGMVFAILALLVAGLILYYFPRTSPRDWTLRLAMGLQLGGATGNLIDRLTMDWRVTDFISIGAFPVFNVADSSITIVVVVLLLGAWLKGRSKQAHAAAEFVSEAGLQAEPSLAVDEARGE